MTVTEHTTEREILAFWFAWSDAGGFKIQAG